MLGECQTLVCLSYWMYLHLKSLSYLLPFLLWHKRLQQCLIHADYYKGVALW